MKHNEKHY